MSEEAKLEEAKAKTDALPDSNFGTEEASKEDLPSGLVTEVTSIAQEEARTGIKQEMPSATELVAKASSSLIARRRDLEMLLPQLSSKQIKRAVIAGLDLPAAGLPVMLKSDQEKLAFALIQRIIADRFIILQHHINEEMKKIREDKAALAEFEAKKVSEQQSEIKENVNESK